MAKKPSFDEAVALKPPQDFTVGKGGHIKPKPDYKRVSYDILTEHHRTLGQAALDTTCKRNAIVRALIDLFTEDEEIYRRAIEKAKQ